MLTVEEVASELRVSIATVYRLIEDGDLKAKKVRGQWRVSRKDLDDYLSK